jgi:hypothetical protein
MKKLLIIFIAFSSVQTTFGQIDLKKAASAASTEASKSSKGIMDTLTSQLGLSLTQTPKISNLVSTFLSAKSTIAPLLQTKPAEYKTKLATAQTELTNGMKGALNPDQFTKFLSLKPKQADAANALSQLFF